MVVLSGATIVGFQRYVHATMSSINAVTVTTRRAIQANWSKPDSELIALADREPYRPGIRIIPQATRPRGVPPPQGTPSLPKPPPHAFAGRPPEKTLESIFGYSTSTIWLHRGEINITPSITIEQLLGLCLGALLVSFAFAVVCSWSIGRWITKQAIEPLATVTNELERFASGDFRPSLLETQDQSELGVLVAAFNGAAAQVVAAFSERERIEQHLRLFLGEAGHEMRTPLTIISAYLELLDKNGTDDVTIPQAMMQTLRGETRRLRSLVERVMALARMEGSDRSGAELIDVAETAEEAIQQATLVQSADVRLTNSVEDVVVLAEPWALHDAIGNLIDNAIRYGGGTPVHVTVDAHGTNVVVRVRDGGPGVSDFDRANLFRHFFRGEQAAGKPGSGLGLAIVQQAVLRLGGTVTLENASSGSTTFRLDIPIYQPHQTPNRRLRVVKMASAGLTGASRTTSASPDGAS